jgi:hypothetical protein
MPKAPSKHAHAAKLSLSHIARGPGAKQAVRVRIAKMAKYNNSNCVTAAPIDRVCELESSQMQASPIC